jgi:hypothetical protein
VADFFACVSYFIFTRQYRRLCTLIAVFVQLPSLAASFLFQNGLASPTGPTPEHRALFQLSEAFSASWRWSPRGTVLGGFTCERTLFYSDTAFAIYRARSGMVTRDETLKLFRFALDSDSDPKCPRRELLSPYRYASSTRP